MTIEDMKRLRNHLDVAIQMAEMGNFKEMTPQELNLYRSKFTDADMVVGDFIILMMKKDPCSHPLPN